MVSAKDIGKRAVLIEDINSFLKKRIEPIAVLDRLWNIPKGIISVVAGDSAVGKSHFLLWNVLRWTEKYSVAYLSVEDPIEILKYRLRRLINKRIYRNNAYVPIVQNKSLVFEYLNNWENPNFDSLYDAILSCVELGYEIIIVDAINIVLDIDNSGKALLKFLFQLRSLCSQKNVNVFLVHRIESEQEEISSKQDLIEFLDEVSVLCPSARYIWFLRRNAKNNNAIEVWNAKNSYLSDKRNFMFEHLLDDGIVKMSPMSFSAGKVKVRKARAFYEVENDKKR